VLLVECSIVSLISSGQWVSEPVLWIAWKHTGQLVATTHCELITLRAARLQEILVQACFERDDPVKRYAKLFVRYFKKNPDDLTDIWADVDLLVEMAHRAFDTSSHDEEIKFSANQLKLNDSSGGTGTPPSATESPRLSLFAGQGADIESPRKSVSLGRKLTDFARQGSGGGFERRKSLANLNLMQSLTGRRKTLGSLLQQAQLSQLSALSSGADSSGSESSISSSSSLENSVDNNEELCDGSSSGSERDVGMLSGPQISAAGEGLARRRRGSNGQSSISKTSQHATTDRSSGKDLTAEWTSRSRLVVPGMMNS